MLVFIFHAKLKRLCIKPGIQERGTECGERGEWGECYISGNVAKHSGEYLQTFRGMSSNIPGNIAKHSGGCGQTFRGVSSNIPGNIAKHSGECPIYFGGRELVEASPITVVFSGALLIVCSVIFYVENLAKLLDAKLSSGGNLISMPWKSFEKFELVSATQDSVSNHRRAISFFFSGGVPKRPWFF